MSQPKSTSVSPPAGQQVLGDRIDLDDLHHPLLVQALGVWTAQKGARPFPARSEMTPRLMAPFLRNIVLVKVLDGGKDYELRIVGDAIVEVQGASFQGLTLAEIDARQPGYGSLLRPYHDEILAGGEPRAYRGQVAQSPTGRSFTHESLLMPLGGEDTGIDHVLVVGTYTFVMNIPG